MTEFTILAAFNFTPRSPRMRERRNKNTISRQGYLISNNFIREIRYGGVTRGRVGWRRR